MRRRDFASSLTSRSLLGWSAFAGLGVIVVLSPVQQILTKRAVGITKRHKSAEDKRYEATRSVLEGIRLWKRCG